MANYWEQVIIINEHQRDRFSKKIIDFIKKENLEPKVLILGWAFKKNTNDTRESAAIYVVNNLAKRNIGIQIYDPKVNENQIESDLLSINPRLTFLKLMLLTILIKILKKIILLQF